MRSIISLSKDGKEAWTMLLLNSSSSSQMERKDFGNDFGKQSKPYFYGDCDGAISYLERNGSSHATTDQNIFSSKVGGPKKCGLFCYSSRKSRLSRTESCNNRRRASTASLLPKNKKAKAPSWPMYFSFLLWRKRWRRKEDEWQFRSFVVDIRRCCLAEGERVNGLFLLFLWISCCFVFVFVFSTRGRKPPPLLMLSHCWSVVLLLLRRLLVIHCHRNNIEIALFCQKENHKEKSKIFSTFAINLNSTR